MNFKNLILVFSLMLMFSWHSEAQETVGTVYKPDISKFNEYAKAALGIERAENASDHNANFYKAIFLSRVSIAKLNKTPSHYTLMLQVPAYNESLRQQDNFNPENFNPFNFKLNYFNSEKTLYYKAYESGYYIIVKPLQPSHN